MRNMKNIRCAGLACAIGLATLTTGCASVTGETTESVSVRTQENAVDVAGAACTLSNSGGSCRVTTPGKVSVHRATDDLAASLQPQTH